MEFSHTYEDIISLENLLIAWKEFLRGKRNKLDVQKFELHLISNMFSLHEELAQRTYQHGEYETFSISDPKPRRIHKALVRDRLLHHAIHRILYPFFDRTFISDVFSCREGKGMHRALDRFRSFAYTVSQNHTRTAWVLKCDIKKFFEHIDHEILLRLLKNRIPDARIMWLLQNIIQSFSVAPGRGLPLGNLTSQLFCNIYLNELDKHVKHMLHERYYLRYGDDFVLISEDRERLVQHLEKIRSFLSDHLRLELHPQKVFIKTVAQGIDFLGWVHFPDHRILRTATKRRMMRRIAEHPTREALTSYRGLLSHGNAKKIEQAL